MSTQLGQFDNWLFRLRHQRRLPDLGHLQRRVQVGCGCIRAFDSIGRVLVREKTCDLPPTACGLPRSAEPRPYRQAPKWRWWERWTLVADFPLGQWRVAPRGWFCRDQAELQAALGDIYSLSFPARDRGRVTVVRTRDVLKADASDQEADHG